jgi:hypothetical protein
MIPPEGATTIDIIMWGFWLTAMAIGIGWMLALIRRNKKR